MASEAGWDSERDAYAAAAGWAVDLVAQVGDRWGEPGLGVWDVRALVGHLSRSFRTVAEYLARPAASVAVPDAASYYRATAELARQAGVAERGVEAGRALGTDPAVAFAALADEARTIVDRCTGSELPTTIAGGIRLVDYLPTRTLELTVHGCDLAVALGLAPAPPAVAARRTLGLLTELAVRAGEDGGDVAGRVLLALTGRRAWEAGSSLL
ncbi:hypothetical protein FH969_09235 [Miniimonas arenae]|uniref:Mycothiol-dependent maleylpyruvate isomerase metal-binding domain-containing protein n=1 Tax=Miniimonas arenae TaxID=676201 RepID=A0A5C5BAX8_9MICO|nr:maleylpyruvate isomerase N-terminal domain-containing protein [Miniimonas arenae]TNU73861.1 hypothetical protein FH969_09235 [Miniimonas arenae]